MDSVVRRIHAGSSPLARGTRRRRACYKRVIRFIPARAGNTRMRVSRRFFSSVHPRSRGEHYVVDPAHGRLYGSSPLARGTPVGGSGEGVDDRFIPARAGNTAAPWASARTPTVHPRSRGEHVMLINQTNLQAGSSPLARGTHPPERRHREDRRFIPARAGNTRRRRAVAPLRQRFIPARAGNTTNRRILGSELPVHPRSRGEHVGVGVEVRARAGSSPLARGTQSISRRRRLRARFIPARAGNTCGPPCCTSPRPVHPRSRGEHRIVGKRKVMVVGSSPLARGTLTHVAGRHLAERFIPARAGNTGCDVQIESRGAVHPRSRGEHSRSRAMSQHAAGSSPLARGTPTPFDRLQC